MAEPLGNAYGPDVPVRIAGMVGGAYPAFDTDRFLTAALDGYEDLELTERARAIARALRTALPADDAEAIGILTDSLGPPLPADGWPDGIGMAPFLYLPHVMVVAEHGLGCFEVSMTALREITRRFTSELGIRPFLVHHREATLARCREWTGHPDAHVRRLVSEGTRPRLPWARRLPEFQRDPAPVLALLERLKDDPSEYVRRSVANNLRRHRQGPPRAGGRGVRAVVGRRGSPASPACAAGPAHVGEAGRPRGHGRAGLRPGRARRCALGRRRPPRPVVGGAMTVHVGVRNTGASAARFLVDLRIGFVGARGARAPKVFKLTEIGLRPGETTILARRISLAQQSTRTHHAGVHTVEVLVNGVVHPVGAIDVGAPAS
jgi:hypothetical protein